MYFFLNFCIILCNDFVVWYKHLYCIDDAHEVRTIIIIGAAMLRSTFLARPLCMYVLHVSCRASLLTTIQHDCYNTTYVRLCNNYEYYFLKSYVLLVISFNQLLMCENECQIQLYKIILIIYGLKFGYFFCFSNTCTFTFVFYYYYSLLVRLQINGVNFVKKINWR